MIKYQENKLVITLPTTSPAEEHLAIMKALAAAPRWRVKCDHSEEDDEHVTVLSQLLERILVRV